MRRDSRYLLYYSGYLDIPPPGAPKGFPAALAIAQSTDGVRFTRVQSEPVLPPTAGGYDNDAVYSPTIIAHDGGYLMVYAGHCFTTCAQGIGLRLLGATSPDGVTWTKRATPVFESPPGLDWARDGVAEPGLVRGPDGVFYLFFTALRDEERVIGVAAGDSPVGPWDVAPDPILVPTAGRFDEAGVLAPFVLIEESKVRMWFLGVDRRPYYAVGYAEADWPLRRGAP